MDAPTGNDSRSRRGGAQVFGRDNLCSGNADVCQGHAGRSGDTQPHPRRCRWCEEFGCFCHWNRQRRPARHRQEYRPNHAPGIGIRSNRFRCELPGRKVYRGSAKRCAAYRHVRYFNHHLEGNGDCHKTSRGKRFAGEGQGVGWRRFGDRKVCQ